MTGGLVQPRDSSWHVLPFLARDVEPTVASVRYRRCAVSALFQLCIPALYSLPVRVPTTAYLRSGGSGCHISIRYQRSNMQANLPELFELLKLQHGLAESQSFGMNTNGCSSAWSPHKESRKEDLEGSPSAHKYLANGFKENGGFYAGLQEAIIASSSPLPEGSSFAIRNGLLGETTGPKLAILTEADIAAIVKKLREFLKDRGPTAETELWAELEAEASTLVRSQFGSLRKLLLLQGGFRQVEEDLDSFLYYDEEEDDEEEEQSRAALSAKVGHMASATSFPVGDKASSTGAASLGSMGRASSSTSYESAEDEPLPSPGSDAQTQTTAAWISTLSKGSQAGPPTTTPVHTQTEGFDPVWVDVLEIRLKKRNQEITELQERLSLLEEEHRTELELLNKKIERLQSRYQKHAEPEPLQQPLKQQHSVSEMKEEIYCLPIEPSDEPLIRSRGQKPVERSPVPDFYELELKMNRQGSCSSDVESMWSSSGGSPSKTKMEQKWDKIIKMVKQKQQSFTEEQIMEYVRQFRESQGGLSRMKFNAIVAGVLALMKNCAPNKN